MIERVVGDVRFALRSLVKHPRFTLLAVAAFAVGIGSNVAIFSLVDDVLLDPLPFPAPERLVLVWERHPGQGVDYIPAAPAKFFEWREEAQLFESMTLWRTDAMDLLQDEGPERITVGQVYPELLPMLGRSPTLGRGFADDEVRPGAPRVAVLTHGFWTERLGSDPDVVGRSLTLDGEPHTVVGVTPPGPVFPAEVDVYRPLALENTASRAAHAYRVLARLAPGVTLDEARRGMDAVADRLATAHPDTDTGFEVTVQPLRQRIMGADTGASLLLLQGAVGLVLLIACANVATLLLARGAGRQREMAVRSALGATRGRLVMQQVTESVILAAGGGVGGLLLASWAGGALTRLSPVELPASDAGLDATVLGFTVGVSLVAGALFGLVPALHGSRRDVASELRTARGLGSGGRARLRTALVTGEVALATLLLLGSGLFLRSLGALGDVDPGFRADGLLTAEVRPPGFRYATGAERLALYDGLLTALEGRPGVASVAAASHAPLEGRTDNFRFQIEGRPVDRFADLLVAPYRAVSDGYFGTLDVEVLRGRGLASTDREGTERVAVVGRAATERFWPGEDPLDTRVSFNGDDGPWVRIVGVVEDLRYDGPAEAAAPALYVPLAQEPWPRATLILRSSGDPLSLVETVRDAVRALDPALPVTSVRSMESRVAAARAPWRFQAVLVSLFGAIAALLAGLGVYGLLNYVVHQRAPEFGVRRALGARAGHLRRLVVREAGSRVAVGIALGLAGGVLLSRTVDAMLFGISPLDPVSYAGAAVLLAALSLLAVWRPVRRALAVDPADVLRGE